MRTRPLGNTGIEVTELCFGTWEIGGLFWGPVDQHEALRFLRQAKDLGISTFDTADVYGNGRSECLLGRAFHDCRDEVVLITKAGYMTGIDGAQFIYDGARQYFDARSLTWSCEMSLRRLETDVIDVFLLHDPPLEILRRKSVWSTLRSLQKQGKIKHFGASTDAKGAVTAIEHGADVVELAFNLIWPDALDELLPLAEREGVGVLARSPFGSGLLLRKGPDSRGRPFRFLAQKGRPLTSAAIKYVLGHSPVSSVVSGVLTPTELKKNMAACQRPLLSAAERRRIAQVHRSVAI
ncbi:MAG: aldo/keto reductase [Candidatus Latescibacterota bacterium]|nr:aldo/keto reductase [Candidatus Latescibacterota bacterium]